MTTAETLFAFGLRAKASPLDERLVSPSREERRRVKKHKGDLRGQRLRYAVLRGILTPSEVQELVTLDALVLRATIPPGCFTLILDRMGIEWRL